MSDEHKEIHDLAEIRKRVLEHEIILVGDNRAFPPIDGMMQILKNVSTIVKDLKDELRTVQTKQQNMETQDVRRLSFLNGAKWVTVILWTVGGAAVGFAIAVMTMLKAH